MPIVTREIDAFALSSISNPNVGALDSSVNGARLLLESANDGQYALYALFPDLHPSRFRCFMDDGGGPAAEGPRNS